MPNLHNTIPRDERESQSSLDDDLVIAQGQPYGSLQKADPSAHEKATSFGESEGSFENPDAEDELAKIPCCACLSRLMPHGGIIANVYNLASATLGAGIVSVPSGFHDSGIIVSIILLVALCGCTIYSLYLLAVAKEKTGFRSYEEMTRGLLGRGWDYVTAFLMFMFCWGTCVGYVISVGDMLEPILDDDRTNAFLHTTAGKRLLQALIWLVGMLTLSLPKQINSLRYASFLGVMMIIFFVICMVVHSAMNGLKNGLSDDLNLSTSGITAVNGFTLFLYAFIVQVNAFEIYNEMRKPTPMRFMRDSIISMGSVALLNFCSGFFGYCDFGAEVTGSILRMYRPLDEIQFMVAYIGICIKLCAGFAICMQPSRDAVYYCLNWGKTSDVKWWVNCLVSAFLSLLALICAFFIPDITIVFNLLGGICGGFLAFLLPAYFFMYSGGFTLNKVGISHYIGCFILIVGGVVAVVFGTAASIYGEVMG